MIWMSGAAALLGALIGLIGALVVSGRQQQTERDSRDQALREARLRERRAQYVALLEAARRLRFIALRKFQRLPSTGDPDEILTDMATALYTIKIISPRATAELATAFHDRAVDFYRLSRDKPRAPKSEWGRKRDLTTEAVQAFRTAIREEFANVSDQDLGRLDKP